MFSTTRPRLDSAAPNGFHFAAISENAAAIAEEGRKRLAEVEVRVRDLITSRPALALGAALAAGVVIGWLIKRR
jgi:hypothetical protein